MTFDAAVLSVAVCGEEVEVVERFTYLGSDIHVSAGCEPEINGYLGSHGFTGSWGGVLSVLVQENENEENDSLNENENESLSRLVLGAPSLALWM